MSKVSSYTIYLNNQGQMVSKMLFVERNTVKFSNTLTSEERENVFLAALSAGEKLNVTLMTFPPEKYQKAISKNSAYINGCVLFEFYLDAESFIQDLYRNKSQ